MPNRDMAASRPGNISPTKPPGILLTPGTATSRRKTVSFGNEVVDKPDEGKGTTQPPRRRASSRASRKTSLTQQLEDAREVKASKTAANKPSTQSIPPVNVETRGAKAAAEKEQFEPSKTKKPEKSNQELLQEMVSGATSNNDMTLDLNEPRSQSGRYWKSQFQSYHDEAKAELQNLLKYKQLAKMYAKSRDSEATNLHEMLRDEQRKVAKMEEKISQLSARIATAGLEGIDDESPELIKELARQTAMALQYKSQVEEFRAALEDGSPEKRNSQDGKILTSPRTEQTLLETNRELKKAREQLREMSSLRSELDSVRHSLSTAEKTIRKLQDENTKLTQELLHADLRLEKHVEKSEKRRQSAEEQRQRKEEALKTLQKDYNEMKERAKSQRRETEHLLKQKHDQAAEMRKEIASLRGADSTAQDFHQALERKTKEHDKIVADLQAEIASLKAKNRRREEIVVSKTSSMPPPERVPVSNENFQAHESQIPVSTPAISKPLKTVASARHLRSNTPAGSPLPRTRSSHSALSEIVNQADVDTVPPTRTSGPVGYTPLMKRFSDMSIASPDLKFSSQEPTPQLPSREIHQRNCRPSPMPSMFNIPSSPKPAMMRPRVSDDLPRKRSSNDLLGRRQPSVNSSQMPGSESSRVRGNLPPERAAAARARLEQKNAEKKRAKMEGEKVNIRE